MNLIDGETGICRNRKRKKEIKIKRKKGGEKNDLGGLSEVGYGWLGRLGRRPCEG